MKVLILQDPPEQIIDYLMNFQIDVPKQEEVTREGFAQFMLQKGYKAKSPETIQKFCDQYNIQPIKRGKLFWYPVKDLEKIPKR